MVKRSDRVAEEIKKVISETLITEVSEREDNLGLITITEVEVTEEMENANVFFTTLNDDKEKTKEMLNKYKGLFRTAVAKKIRMRKAPEICFHYDGSVEYGSRIDELLNQIIKED